MELTQEQIDAVVAAALAEDLGAGDATTLALVPEDARCRAELLLEEPGVVCGVPVAAAVFRALDPSVRVEARLEEGAPVSEVPAVVAEAEGPARAILSGERVALNLLGRLSGIASLTRRFVQLTDGTPTTVLDTRKTTPGLRALEKYAVRCGGGSNHRFGLDDAVLIKDNHLALAGSIRAAVDAVRKRVGHMVKVEVEVDTLEQLREALETHIDAVLLDNMTPQQLAQAVALAGGRVLTEASGTITAERIVAIAASGVDLISSGWITHSAPALDLGLDVEL